MNKKEQKALEDYNKAKSEARNFGNSFKGHNVFIKPNGSDKDIETNLISPDGILKSWTRNKIKKVFDIDIEKEVFKDLLDLQEKDKKLTQDQIQFKTIELLQEKYITKIYEKAITNNIKEVEVDGKKIITLNEKSKELKELDSILNKYINYNKELSIVKDEIPEDTITNILILVLMLLVSPS